MKYGPVAFPFLGVVAAVSLIFLQRQWLQYCVILAAVLLIVCILRALLFSYIGPAHPNAQRRTSATRLSLECQILQHHQLRHMPLPTPGADIRR